MADMAVQAGVEWTREGFAPDWIEPSPGVYDTNILQMYDQVVSTATNRGLNILGLIQPSYAWVSSSNAPASPADFQQFSNFVHFITTRYQGVIKYWEIWNEPNSSEFWKPAPDAANYVELLKNAYHAAKHVDPTIQIVGVSGSYADYDFYTNVFGLGGGNYMDILSIHTYPYQVPQVIENSDQMVGIRELNIAMTNYALNLPMWVTETGWPTISTDPLGVTDALQADFLVRTYLTLISEGVEMIMWYNFGPDGDPAILEETFGITHPDLTPKTGYHAFSNMTAQLAGLQYEGTVDLGWGTMALAYRNATSNETTLVLWRYSSVGRIYTSIVLDGPLCNATDIIGNPIPIIINDQGYKIPLSGSPIYLTGGFSSSNITLNATWATPFVTFDDLPATASNSLPGSSSDWLYTTATINPDITYNMTIYDLAGWRNTNTYPYPFNQFCSYFYQYLNTYNSSHMGFSTYGYSEIDPSNVIHGSSLRFTTTGGVNLDGTNGLRVTTKAQYTNYLHLGQDPVAHGVQVGHPYYYFANSSPTYNQKPFAEAQGANRMSMYIYAPASLTNGVGGWGNRPTLTINMGPFNGEGGHWYHEFCNQGGGWMHVLTDGHPQHNNSWSSPANYPYPSSSLRDMGTGYFTNWYRWYMTFKPYEGIATVPYHVWVDEVKFIYDPEPQNNETINNPTITYLPASNTFELGFMDKYKNFARSYSTYELRYSFDQIDNANWSNATPAHILEDLRFGISNRLDGKFHKWWPYYVSVWAPYELQSNDFSKITPGSTIYFAIKDISQIDGDGMNPITNTVGRWTVGGRDYLNDSSAYDYAGDQPALKLIKRTDFRIPQDLQDSDNDGLPDWWETRYANNPTNMSPTDDADNDDANNLAEFFAETNPTNQASRLELTSTIYSNAMIIQWAGGKEATQLIEYRKELSNPSDHWTPIATNHPPTSITNQMIYQKPDPYGCYRIRIQ